VEVEVSADDADTLGRLVGSFPSMSLRLPIRQQKAPLLLLGILRGFRLPLKSGPGWSCLVSPTGANRPPSGLQLAKALRTYPPVYNLW